MTPALAPASVAAANCHVRVTDTVAVQISLPYASAPCSDGLQRQGDEGSCH
jgi:hypothetical protein